MINIYKIYNNIYYILINTFLFIINLKNKVILPHPHKLIVLENV